MGDELGREQQTHTDAGETETETHTANRKAGVASESIASTDRGHRHRATKTRQKDENEPGNQAERSMVKLTRAVVGLTGVSAFAAVGAVIFAGLQWHEMHEGGKQLDRQIAIAEKQSRTGEVQAQSGRELVSTFQSQLSRLDRQIGLSKDALSLEERQVSLVEEDSRAARLQSAELSKLLEIAEIEIDVPETPGSTPMGIVRIKNAGMTSVHQEDMYSVMGTTLGEPEDVSKKALETFAKAPRNHYPLTLGPGLGYTHRNTMSNDRMEGLYALFSTDRLKIVFFVEVIYRDAAGALHHTYSCAYSSLMQRNQVCVSPPND